MLAFVVQNGMIIHQMDVVIAFLNGALDEEIYMEQPPGEGTDLTVVAVYVDNLTIATKTLQVMKMKDDLSNRFKMKGLGKIHYFLGIAVEYDEEKNSSWMHQRRYILTLLDKYGLSEAKPSTTPADINVKLVKHDGVSKYVDQVIYQSMVGSLLYAATATRPDNAQAVGAVSKFNSCPTKAYLTAVKQILRYLKG